MKEITGFNLMVFKSSDVIDMHAHKCEERVLKNLIHNRDTLFKFYLLKAMSTKYK